MCRKPEANTGHMVHPTLFVFAQKTDKFWFVANGMRTNHRWHSTRLQSHLHICTFVMRTIWFTCVYHLKAWCEVSEIRNSSTFFKYCANSGNWVLIHRISWTIWMWHVVYLHTPFGEGFFTQQRTIYTVMHAELQMNEISQWWRVVPLPSHIENVSHFEFHNWWYMLMVAPSFSYYCLHMCEYFYTIFFGSVTSIDKYYITFRLQTRGFLENIFSSLYDRLAVSVLAVVVVF